MTDEDDPETDTTDLYFLNQPEPPLPTSILPTNTPPNNPTTFPNTNPENFHLSMQAINGQPSPKTFRFAASILGHAVSVLIDSGSSHNIIQSRVASFLNLPTSNIEPFKVMVGNGDYLECAGFCPTIPLQIQTYIFNVPFYVFPIQGADVVLGIQWLQSVGPLFADFTIPGMQFYYQGSLVTIHGNSSPHLTHASFHQFTRMLHTDSIATCHAITMLPTDHDYQLPPPNKTDCLSTPSEESSLSSMAPELAHLMTKYSHIFSTPHGLPPTRPHDHHIHLLPNAQPVNLKPYRYPHFQKEAMTSLIVDMLKEGIIRPSTSPYSSPVLLVKKKDGSWRFCVDYRALNALTIRDRFPIPTIDELLDELKGAAFFSKIDLRSGYHQIRLAEEDIPKTRFRTFDGHYEFLVMPFGLTNAPSTFQAAMNDLLRPFLRKFVLIFFDDILIFSKSWNDHFLHVEQVLKLLLQHQFYAKFSKCRFGVTSMDYLGHIINNQGVKVDPSKIQAMLEWPVPKSITALRGFLGLTGFYRRFVQHYATIASPLTDLLKSNKFSWTPEAAKAFENLKKAMINLPLLALPDFDVPFEVTTDASTVAIGVVLSQNHHPIAFFSKKMSPRLCSSSTYIRELYALTEAVKKWRQYLLGTTFKIYTDHKSLKGLMNQSIQTPEQHKWLTKLVGYSYEIIYKPGKENVVADALSRIEEENPTPIFAALSAPSCSIASQLQHFFTHNTAGQQMLNKLQTDQNMQQKFSMKSGLLYFKDRIFIPSESGLIPSILEEFHSSPVGGHSGIKATLARLSTLFYWPGMHADVKDFIRRCDVCQYNKYDPHSPYGLLQPLSIPHQVWEDISMDFITSLPPSANQTVIWVVVDRLSKFVHFVALPTSFSASQLASVFVSEIYRLHGVPKTIVSDRDKVFISKFWKELF